MNHQEDQDIFNNLAETLYPEVVNLINEGSRQINLISLIIKFVPEDLSVIRNKLSVKDVHYGYLEKGIANRIIPRINQDFPHKETRHISSWGSDPLIIISE